MVLIEGESSDIQVAPNKEGQIIEQSSPEAIRYLLIVSFVATNKDLWQKNVKNDAFYEESMKILRGWVNMSDAQLKEKYPKLPMKV
jgi:hypothetical protein